ncbi:MAG: type II toxin-antitoxin system Phd/YefM family antitoxin [Terriglobales bacterium]
MANIIPALTARTQFGQILRRVKQNKERFVVDKRGEPQAVIMSVEEYLQKFVKRPSAAVTAIRREAKARGLNKLSLRQINLAIKQVRQERRRAAR